MPGKDYSFAKYVYQGAGTHYVTICGKGDTYVGEMTTSFQIKGTKASSLKVGSVVYTGKTIKPIITDRYGTQLREGTDYRINALTGTESVGTAKINITGINAYYGTAAKSFKVTARPMDSADISASFVREGTTQPYEKNGAKPKLIVKQGEKVLEQGVDYTLSYKNNVNAATWNAAKAPSVTIKLKGQYQGSVTLYYTIKPLDINNIDIYNTPKVSPAYEQTVNYSKKLNIPAPVLTYGKKKLAVNKDFVCDLYQARRRPDTFTDRL